ncbi:hypothetical protein ACWEOI_27480 [Nocardia sp. NPDC004340]|uniref:hypothetical protein n=1 Tax=Nocardia sp. CA-136227 TaxID=3239979 RepID=UPI003D9802ED
MSASVRIGTALAGAALTAAAVSISGSAVASAETVVADPNAYLVGDTVYFSYSNLANCAIKPTGDVGCDATSIDLRWYGLPVTNLTIDAAFLPAHPAIGPIGVHGRPGSPLLTGGGPTPGSNSPYGPDATITYAGTTCNGSGFRGAISCNAKGHHFTFGFVTDYN